MLGKLSSAGSQSSQDPCQSHARGPLDVIIEGAILLTVLVQQTEGVVLAKVFKLNESMYLGCTG